MTTVALTADSFLDLHLMQQQFETAKGSTFTIFSLLDPALMQAQMEAKVGHAIFSNTKGLLDPTWGPVSLSAAIG